MRTGEGMNRLTSGLLGVLVGMVLTLTAQRIGLRGVPSPPDVSSPVVSVQKAPPFDAKRSAALFANGPRVLQQALPGSKCLDVSLGSPSKHEVNYVYDALYDVDLTYRYQGVIKRVSLPFGFTHEVMVAPTTSQIVIADDTAEVLHKSQAAQAQGRITTR